MSQNRNPLSAGPDAVFRRSLRRSHTLPHHRDGVCQGNDEVSRGEDQVSGLYYQVSATTYEVPIGNDMRYGECGNPAVYSDSRSQQ
jgi:hypothetical protein